MKITKQISYGLIAVLVLAAGALRLRAADDLVPLNLKLPAEAFKGTPKDIKTNAYTEPYPDKPRPAMMVPSGLKNLTKGAKTTTSDKNATQEMLDKITDGDKEAADQSIIFLRKGTQYVQLDLGSPNEIFAVVIWHAFNAAKVYHDVVVQIADNADFTQNVKTIFNNDQDNSSGLGVGTDREYFETQFGRAVDGKGTKARYVRGYTKGGSLSALNCWQEIEVYALPAK
jgi:hypothetical protein